MKKQSPPPKGAPIVKITKQDTPKESLSISEYDSAKSRKIRGDDSESHMKSQLEKDKKGFESG